jgi:hypothetical protein
MRIRPAELFHQPGGIVGIIGHGEGSIALPALAQAALVVSQKVEMLSQGAAKPGFRPAKVSAGAPDQEQGGACALALIKEGMAPDFGEWHGGPPDFEILLQSIFAGQ